MTTVEDVLAHEITIIEDRVRIDVQTWTPGVDFADAWERRKTISMQGQDVPVISKSDLISAKRASGRPIDLEDVRSLESGHE